MCEYKVRQGIIYLRGIIGEESDFTQLVGAFKEYRIDMKMVININSLGTRKWTAFTAALPQDKLFFLNVPSNVFSLVHIVPSLLGLGSRENCLTRIESYCFEMVCDQCANSILMTISAKALGKLLVKNQIEYACNVCNAQKMQLTENDLYVLDSILDP
tara:strand:+ start:769 stop:1242 length:474 start_codon:yes stop_codon:yes gene_type:complete